MSGTSQSAAVVSGVVALMLQADPVPEPDEVKCRLIASARPAVDAQGELAYSPLQQGAGMINAYDAVYSTKLGCANRGLDITARSGRHRALRRSGQPAMRTGSSI